MDNLTKEQRRKNMQNIRSQDTQPEKMIARELRKHKIYFAKNVKSIIGIPDFIFRRRRVAVFVDSDFWHGHPSRGVTPKTNEKYWIEKIKRNRLRDKKVNKELRSRGWTVLRLWEYDIKKRIDQSVQKILKIL